MIRRRLPERFTLVMHGRLGASQSRIAADQGATLAHSIKAILRGEEFPLDILKGHGITLFVEEDMDQGDDITDM